MAMRPGERVRSSMEAYIALHVISPKQIRPHSPAPANCRARSCHFFAALLPSN